MNVTKEIIEKIELVYREICIAENAYKHDVGGYNGNFEQRRIGVEDVFLALGLYTHAGNIRDEVADQIWTRSSYPDGRIKYEQIG